MNVNVGVPQYIFQSFSSLLPQKPHLVYLERLCYIDQCWSSRRVDPFRALVILLHLVEFLFLISYILVKARLHRPFLSRNSMQFLSRRSCNFNIARVNQLRFQRDFIAAISQEFRTCSKLDAILPRFLIKM